MSGLFDFVKDAGEKLIEGEDVAKQLRERFEAEGKFDIPDLEVNFFEGTVTLTGNAPNAEAKEKAVLFAGNIADVESVQADQLVSPDLDQEVQYYVIQAGDNLSKIAKQFYGNANEYPKIVEANSGVIKNADSIFPGQKIRIPNLA